MVPRSRKLIPPLLALIACISACGDDADLPLDDAIPGGDTATDANGYGMDGADVVGLPTPGRATIAFTSNRDAPRGEGGSDIYVMDVGGANLRRITEDSSGYSRPAWSPDGKSIAFTSWRDGATNAEIYVMDANGGNQRNISNHPGVDSSPAWHGPPYPCGRAWASP